MKEKDQGARSASAIKLTIELTPSGCRKAFAAIEALSAKQIDCRIAGLPGAVGAVYPDDIDFAIRVRVGSERPRLSLGKFSDTPLEQVRENYTQLRQLVAEGKDPRLFLPKKTTFSAFFEQHYRVYSQSQGKRSIAADESRYAHWLQPHFGTLLLCNISPLKIQGLITAMQAKGLSNSTINNAGHLLNAALNHAEHLNFLAVNSPRFRPLPSKKISKPVMEIDDLRRFYDEAKRCQGDEFVGSRLLMLAVLTGARLGELLNLKHADIDTRSGIWTLSQQKSGKAGEIVLSEAALDIVYDMMSKRRGEFLFPGCKGNAQLSRPIKLFNRICERAGISAAPGIHGCRHAYISAGVNANLSIELLSQAARHSDVKTTRIYSHPYRSALKQTNEVIAGQVIPHQYRRIRPQYGRFEAILAAFPKRNLLMHSNQPVNIKWQSFPMQ